MSNSTTKYPFETDHLQKGDSIPAEIIEKAYSVSKDTKEYQFAAMAANHYVVRQFLDRGEVVTVIHRDGSLVILTDEEQVEYNADRFKQGVRDARKAHTRMLGADRSQIKDPRLLEAHDRRLEVQGRVLNAITKETKVIRPSPATRSTPGLPPGKSE